MRGFRENPLADNSLKFKLNRGWREEGGYREGGVWKSSEASPGEARSMSLCRPVRSWEGNGC